MDTDQRDPGLSPVGAPPEDATLVVSGDTGGFASPSSGYSPPPPPPPLVTDEPVVPPPVVPPVDRSGSSGGRGGWRSALIGGVVGAVVASLVAGGIVAATDDDGGSTTRVVTTSGPSRTLDGEELDVAGVLEKVNPAVVSIHTTVTQENFGPFGGSQSGESSGSGVIIESSGVVLTNAHVVDGATAIEVDLADGTTAEATVIGSLGDEDVALLQLDGVNDLPVAELGDSDSLQVGDDVVAIGNALNLGATPTVTTGIVSALQREISVEGVQFTGLIQTSAPINQGNSGGPLVDAVGKVVGINSALASDSQNVGFALAINDVKTSIDAIQSGETDSTTGSDGSGSQATNRAVLGVSVRDGDTGALVASVTADGPAASAGIEAGDEITEVDGETIQSADDLVAALADLEPGDEVSVTYLRDGSSATVSVELGANT